MNSAVLKARSVGLLAVLCAVAACGPAARPNAKASASPSVTAKATAVPIDSAPEAEAKAWRALDVSVIPPRGFAQDVHLTQDVINHTGGRIDDATARRWAEDYLRTDKWGAWGTENLQVDGFFNHLAPGDSTTQQKIYGAYYSVIDAALRVKGTVRTKNLEVNSFTLVVVPDEVKKALTGQFGYPGPIPDFALVVDSHGPAGATIVHPDGTTEQPIAVPATYRERGYVVGEPKSFPGTLGDIWFSHTGLGCSINDYIRASCAS